MKSSHTSLGISMRVNAMERRQMILSPDDVEYLENAFPGWESLQAGNWVLLPNFPIPEGLSAQSATVAIQIPPNYPVTAPDMAYFYPAIQRCDGTTIPATQVTQNIDGKIFQRWSRHYSPGTWHPDEDGIAIHIMAIKDWLDRASI